MNNKINTFSEINSKILKFHFYKKIVIKNTNFKNFPIRIF